METFFKNFKASEIFRQPWVPLSLQIPFLANFSTLETLGVRENEDSQLRIEGNEGLEGVQIIIYLMF